MSKANKIPFLSLIVFLFLSPAYAQHNHDSLKPSIVEIAGQKGNWSLMVNGKPFYIKGVGCGEYVNEENIDKYFSWAKELGANSIRRWGISDYDDLILDKCKEYGLMAMMGFWLPVTIDYASDEYSKEMLLERIEEFVNEHKDHPNILMWGIGNEVIILGEMKLKEWKRVILTKEEKEKRRIGFAKFLQNAVERIHKIDPNHPVVYAGSGLTALKYIKEYTPALDVYGINFYKGSQVAYSEWKKIEAEIPYIFTEFGPPGYWEVEKDVNNQPIEPTDEEKAKTFMDIWKEHILKHAGCNLGGFAFHLTEKKLLPEGGSPTWWGLTFDGYKNASFWSLRKAYTGKEPQNRPPLIQKFTLSKIKNVKPNETIYCEGKVYDYENDPLKLKIKIFDVNSSMFLEDYSKIIETQDKVKIQVPYEGVYRVFLFATDEKGNIASTNRSVLVE